MQFFLAYANFTNNIELENPIFLFGKIREISSDNC